MRQIVIFFCLLTIFNARLFGQQKYGGKENPTGQITMPRTGKKLKFQTQTLHIAALNAASIKQYAPNIAKQRYADCYAYASVYAGRTILYNISNKITGSPDSTIFSTGFLQKITHPNAKKCRKKGYDTYTACLILRDTGVVFKFDYPDECAYGRPLTPDLLHKAFKFRVNAIQIYKDCDSKDVKIGAIKNSICSNNPVVIAWFSLNSFNKYGYHKELWVPTATDYRNDACRNGANHAICIVGYNDSMYDGAFEIMNSWGTDWGTGGFMWIKYADMAQFSAFGIELSNRK